MQTQVVVRVGDARIFPRSPNAQLVKMRAERKALTLASASLIFEYKLLSLVGLRDPGNLLAIGLGKGVIEYDWDGRLVWEFKIEDGYAHHDVIRLENGNTMLIESLKLFVEENHRPRANAVEIDHIAR